MALAQVRPVIERLAPPRGLYAEFPLGRPLGRPRDIDFQHRVLAAAFDLLNATMPTLADFSEAIRDEAETVLACPLPPRSACAFLPAIDEVRGLRAAYERGRAERDRPVSEG